MSTLTNDNFIDSKWDTFKWALDMEDWDLAQEIVDNLFEEGLSSQAVDFGRALLTRKMTSN